MDSMNIALYISPAHAVPPETSKILAPWWIVRDVADGLVKRGHDVTVFAGKGSKTLAKVIDLGIEPFDDLQTSMSDKEYQTFATHHEQRLASLMYEMSTKGSFDIIGNHLVLKTLPFTRFTNIPTVYTLHDPITPEKLIHYQEYRDEKSIHYIAISNAQKIGADLPFAGVVYNGISIEEYPVGFGDGGYLLCVGRIRQEKGVSDAIEASKMINHRLLIAGEHFDQYPVMKTYWDTEVKPHIDGKNILYESVLPKEALRQRYGNAKALLFPIHWEEPFGLVMIEAMACGTPVIAYNRGSVSEIVRDGVTGFIVDEKKGVGGLVEAIGRINEIDRNACRKHVEDNFTVEKMVEGYEKVYEKVLRGI